MEIENMEEMRNVECEICFDGVNVGYQCKFCGTNLCGSCAAGHRCRDSFLERFLNANQKIYDTIKNAPNETSAQTQLEMMAAFEKEDHHCSFCGNKVIEGEKVDIVRGRWVACFDPECLPKSLQLIAFLKGDILIQPDVTEFFKKRLVKEITDFITVKEMFFIMGKLMEVFDPNK